MQNRNKKKIGKEKFMHKAGSEAMSIIPVFGRQKQNYTKFKASLIYIVSARPARTT